MGSPKLIFNLATGKWLLQVDDAFWTLRSTSDALTIAGYLQLSVVDKSSSDYLVIAKGHAMVSGDPGEDCHIELQPLSAEEKPQTLIIKPEQVNFGILDCYKGFHPDLWVETDAMLITENIQTLGLKFYLPKSKDHGQKMLNIFVGEKKMGSLDLRRGDPDEVWIDIPDHASGPKEISIQCDYKDPNATDERNLGMIFVEYNVNLTTWNPAGDLL